jgi:polar amino acid transport system substrate-binding protein
MKRISLVVLLSMLLALLAACGGAGTGSDTTGATSTAASPAASTAAASAAASAAPSTEASAAASSAATTTGGAVPDLGGREITIGTDSTYPPFESIGDNNQIVGFDVDLMNEIGKLANFKPVFQTAAFDTIFTALQSGQFDAVMSAATITDERKQIVAFSDPYIEVGQLVVTRADNTAITGYQDLASGPIVGVQTGTTGEEAARGEAKVPDANLKGYQTIDLAFAELSNSTIDAVVADGPTVGNYTAQDQYKDKLKIVGEPFTTESYGIAVQQSNTELQSAINAALAQLKQNGVIDQLKEKYQIK